MGFFDSIVEAKSYNNLPYIEPGNFEFVIDNVLHHKSQQGKGDFLIAEFSIVKAESQNPGLQVGGRCALRCKLVDATGAKNAKAFLLAALSSARGRPVNDVSEADQNDIFGPESVLIGKRVACSAFLKPKKLKAGEMYTHVNWFAVSQ